MSKDIVPAATLLHESSLYLLKQNPGYSVHSTKPPIKIYPAMENHHPHHAKIVFRQSSMEGLVMGFLGDFPRFNESQLELNFRNANMWELLLQPYLPGSRHQIDPLNLEQFPLASRLLARLQADVNTIFVKTILDQERGHEEIKRILQGGS